MSSQPKWWEKPLRVLDVLYVEEIEKTDFKWITQLCKEAHANVIHFQCHYCYGGGLDENVIFHRSRLAKKQNRDVLAEFLPLAHKADIRVLIYYPGHWFPKTFGDQHPDWCVIKDDGSRVENLYGNNDLPFCVNSPWRDWSYILVEDLFAYEIDGIFFDGPINFLGDRACYCESCKEKFQQIYGREMPPWNRNNIEDWKMLVDFSVNSLADYYKDAYSLIKGLKPDAFMYCNASNVAEQSWYRGRRNRSLMPHQDALIAEGGFVNCRLSKNLFKTGASAKMYETQAGGKPAVTAVSPALGVWRTHSHSAPEMRLLLAQASIATNPYLAIYIKSKDQPGPLAAKQMYAFLEQNAPYYHQTRSGANVALLHSTQTVNFYQGVDIPWADISNIKEQTTESIGNFNRTFYGFYEIMIRSRIPFDVIDEEALIEELLNRYEALVLPNCACLSEDQCRTLTDYVKRGGVIIADFESSHYDEFGCRRRHLGLEEVFGVTSQNEVSDFRRQDFVLPKEKNAPALKNLDCDFLPAPRHNLKLNAGTGKSLAVFTKPLISNITDDIEPSDDPFLVENSLGKGKGYYFPTTFGEFYQEYQIPAYHNIVESILRSEISVPISLAGAPHLIEVMLRRQPEQKRTMVHLINFEISSINEVIPAKNLTVSVRNSSRVARVRALKACKDLAFEQNKDTISFVVPHLEEHELIIIES